MKSDSVKYNDDAKSVKSILKILRSRPGERQFAIMLDVVVNLGLGMIGSQKKMLAEEGRIMATTAGLTYARSIVRYLEESLKENVNG